MEIKRQKSEIKVRFGELNNIDKKVVDLRKIDSQFIIKIVEAKIKELKTRK